MQMLLAAALPACRCALDRGVVCEQVANEHSGTSMFYTSSLHDVGWAIGAAV